MRIRRIVALTASAIVALAGLALIVAALWYWIGTSRTLPDFFPGHDASDRLEHHGKHGIVACALGLASFYLAWWCLRRARWPS